MIEFWKAKEITNLYKQIQEAENSIKQFDLELLKIRRERTPSIKDFALLCHKFGNKNYNKGMIQIYHTRLNLLKNNNINEEEYYGIGIY